MKPLTVVQIPRCRTVGGYTARVVDGRLVTAGPQPLAGPLAASIKARPDELVGFLSEWCGGAWPPAREPMSTLREAQELKDCSLADVLDALERSVADGRIRLNEQGLLRTESEVFPFAT